MFGRNKIATLVAEFLGTGILTLLVLSVQRSTIGVPFFVALAAGLSLAVTVSALHQTSGAHFNPALSIAMWTTRRLGTLSTILYVVVQLLGAWAAYWLYTYFAKNSLQPIGGKFDWHIFTAEAVGTGIYAFGVASTVYKRHSSNLVGVYTGLAFTIGIIAASAASIGLLNPALALGVRAWVWGTYVLGPIVGAIVGVNVYHYLFHNEDSVALVPVAAASTTRVSSTGEAVETTTVVARRKPRTTVASKTTGRKTTVKKPVTKRATRTR